MKPQNPRDEIYDESTGKTVGEYEDGLKRFGIGCLVAIVMLIFAIIFLSKLGKHEKITPDPYLICGVRDCSVADVPN